MKKKLCISFASTLLFLLVAQSFSVAVILSNNNKFLAGFTNILFVNPYAYYTPLYIGLFGWVAAFFLSVIQVYVQDKLTLNLDSIKKKKFAFLCFLFCLIISYWITAVHSFHFGYIIEKNSIRSLYDLFYVLFQILFLPFKLFITVPTRLNFVEFLLFPLSSPILYIPNALAILTGLYLSNKDIKYSTIIIASTFPIITVMLIYLRSNLNG